MTEAKKVEYPACDDNRDTPRQAMLRLADSAESAAQFHDARAADFEAKAAAARTDAEEQRARVKLLRAGADLVAGLK